MTSQITCVEDGFCSLWWCTDNTSLPGRGQSHAGLQARSLASANRDTKGRNQWDGHWNNRNSTWGISNFYPQIFHTVIFEALGRCKIWTSRSQSMINWCKRIAWLICIMEISSMISISYINIFTLLSTHLQCRLSQRRVERYQLLHLKKCKSCQTLVSWFRLFSDFWTSRLEKKAAEYITSLPKHKLL